MERNKLSHRGDLPDQLNYTIGQKIRLQRNLLGLSQKKLAEAIGVTFQQIQKYEKGINQFTISRLCAISRALSLDLSFFLNEQATLKPTTDITYDTSPSAPVMALTEKPQFTYDPEINLEQLTTRETIHLVKAYYKIQNPQTRRKVMDLINLMIKDEQSA